MILKRFIKELCCYTIQPVTTEDPINSCLTFTKDKTNHRPVIAPFSVQILKHLLNCFLATPKMS